MSAPSIEECRKYLSNPCEQADGKSKSVVDHLSMLLLKILETKPNNAIDVFEQISAEVKAMPVGGALDPPIKVSPNVEWALDLEALRGTPKPLAEGEEPEVVKAIDGEALKITNFTQEAAMFDAAGIGAGITRMNALSLFAGFRKLANKHPVKSVRLFGKILGLKRDYLICECEYDDSFAEEEPAAEEAAEGADAEASKKPRKIPPEASKTGINKYVYFVADWNDKTKSHDLTKWIKLPNVNPECLMVARAIKKSFTGNLKATIVSFPPFPGNEADYLRCQIARIAAGATVCLKGMFVIDPEAEEGGPAFKLNIPDDEGKGGFTPPTASQFVNTDMWVHHPEYSSILKGMGRCKEPDGETLEDEAAEKKRLAAIEKGEKPLKDMSMDRSLSGMPAWSASRCSPSLRDHSVSMIRSNRWPGAVCVAKGPKYANIYVGTGHKYVTGGFQCFSPPTVNDEYSQMEKGGKEQEDDPVKIKPPEPVEPET